MESNPLCMLHVVLSTVYRRMGLRNERLTFGPTVSHDTLPVRVQVLNEVYSGSGVGRSGTCLDIIQTVPGVDLTCTSMVRMVVRKDVAETKGGKPPSRVTRFRHSSRGLPLFDCEIRHRIKDSGWNWSMKPSNTRVPCASQYRETTPYSVICLPSGQRQYDLVGSEPNSMKNRTDRGVAQDLKRTLVNFIRKKNC